MPRTKIQSDDQVLEATGRVLLRRGPHDFTLADIAREVGLSPATLIQRFGTKRGLVFAFAQREADRARSRLETRPGRSRGLGGLRAAIRQPGGVATRKELANSLALLLEDIRDDELRVVARRHAERIEVVIREHLEAARLRGEIAPIAVPKLARLVQAAWNGAMIQWALRGEGPLDAWVADTLETLIQLLSARTSRTRVPSGRPKHQ